MLRAPFALLAATLAVAAFGAHAAAAGDREPTLLARAILPADAYQPGPPRARSSRPTTV